MPDAWDAIKVGVYSLPHKVEWFENGKIGDQNYLRSEVRNTFVVPSTLVDMLGNSSWDKAQELADTTKCELVKANDGSMIFKRRT